MEWYVLWHEFNSDKIESFNIFDSTSFKQEVDKLLEEFITFDDFKEKLDGALKYSFLSKAEYEIMCSGLFDRNKAYRIDVYTQVKPNLDILARYIIEEYDRKLVERESMIDLVKMIKKVGDENDNNR